MSNNTTVSDEMISEFSKTTGLYTSLTGLNNVIKEWEIWKAKASSGGVAWKDWEIISLKDNCGIIRKEPIIIANETQRYALLDGWTINTVSIHGMGVFSVGDDIKQTHWSTPAKIKSIFPTHQDFRINDARQQISFTLTSQECVADYNIYKGFPFFEKVSIPEPKKPLFTTEDGKYIFLSHEVVWFVNGAWYCGSEQAASYDSDKLSHFKYFSTEQAAQRYICLHKSVFSLNEIVEEMKVIFPTESEWHLAKLEHRLNELVKSKIEGEK